MTTPVVPLPVMGQPAVANKPSDQGRWVPVNVPVTPSINVVSVNPDTPITTFPLRAPDNDPPLIEGDSMLLEYGSKDGVHQTSFDMLA